MDPNRYQSLSHKLFRPLLIKNADKIIKPTELKQALSTENKLLKVCILTGKNP